MGGFVAALDAEIADLLAALEGDIRYRRLKELERIRSDLYASSNEAAERPMESATPEPRQSVRSSFQRTSPERLRALDAARMLLANRSGPVPTGEILEHLTGLGIAIGGAEPRNNLSAMLSNAGQFQANGRSGWTLRQNTEDEDDKRMSDSMAVQEVREAHMAKIDRLKAELAEHDRRYHVEDAPSITDAEYDAMRRHLAELEGAPISA